MSDRTVSLGELVELRTEKVATGKKDFEPYVGLENLGVSGSGLLGWSHASDSISLNSAFEPGDILFGKLRPNLQKCEQIEFSGYCSTELLVLRARPGVDPRFAARVLQSEPVFDEAIRSAEGTRMPRTSWNKIQAFRIPWIPPAHQRMIADILDTAGDMIRSTERLIAKLDQVKQGLLHDLLTRGMDSNGHLRVDHTQQPGLYRDTQLGPIPMDWTVQLLDDVSVRGSGHTPNKDIAAYWNGGIKWVSLADSARLDKIYITETDKEISDLGIVNSSAVKHRTGTVILSRDAGVGKSAILAQEMAVSQHFIAWACGETLDNYYLYYWLQFMKPRFEAIAMGSTIKTIGLPFFRRLVIPLPRIDQQKTAAAQLLAADADIVRHQVELSKQRLLKQGLMDDLLTGRARVGASA